jgi:spore maturation protein A
MLNYIWAGLIVSSLLFAVGYDARDLARDRYRNGEPLPVELDFPEGYDPDARRVPVQIRIPADEYGRFYGSEERPEASYAGYILQTQEGAQLRFEGGASLPEPLATIATVSKSNDDELQGALVGFTAPSAPAVAPPPADSAAQAGADVPPAPTTTRAAIRFEPVRFVKLLAISAAAFDLAETAATLALGLIGVLSLFLGLLKIAEASGVIYSLVKLVRPVLRPLFPGVPADHPAFGLIALNITANVFGLGNAATPFGIKAMEELQKLNRSSDTATNAMVTFLAINTASVQLVPPVLLVALMGLQVNELIFPIIITTFLGLIVAIISARLYQNLPGARASDPDRNPPPAAPAVV